MTDHDDQVLYVMDGPVAIITINRPDHANSLNRTVRSGLYAAWDRFESDPAARVAILTGAGDRAFCAGADLSEMADEAAGQLPPDWVPVLGDNIQVTKPTIAAVNGAAMGGGFLQAQMCDIAIASRNARFGITEARWGRGSPWALPLFKMIPRRTVMELLLTAQPMDAQRAYDSGFVNRVVRPEDLLSEAVAMAKVIAGNAPLSLAAAKTMARISQAVPDPDRARQETTSTYARVYRSNDAQIGPRAFRERVAPKWTGS